MANAEILSLASTTLSASLSSSPSLPARYGSSFPNAAPDAHACLQDFSGQTQCDAGQAKALLDNVTDWMSQQDYIQGWFWFGPFAWLRFPFRF